MSRQLDVTVDANKLEALIQDHWSAVSALAHIIHNAKAPDPGMLEAFRVMGGNTFPNFPI